MVWTAMQAVGAIALTLTFLFMIRSKSVPKGLRLPPGPPGNIIVGNTEVIPQNNERLAYTQLSKEYGDLVYTKGFRQGMVFVNSMDVARELFEARSALYSDRCDFRMMNELIGFDWSFVFMRYSQRWRRHRKAFHQHFHPTAVVAYHHIQTERTRTLLRRLQQSPDDMVGHIRHFAGATIMEIVYGIKVLPIDDPYVHIAQKALAAPVDAAKPGAFLVDTLPILKHVPEWIPGADFKRKAREWRISAIEMVEKPFSAVKNALRAGTAGSSVVASLLEELSRCINPPEDQKEIIRNVGAVAYAAGFDTTQAVLITFMLAMVLYPEAQRKAQAEIDSVIGMGRLPSFEDRENLPYINALCKEVYRWNPAVPLGIAHRLTQDDVYGDYFIPGGSIVIGNALAILHDEKLFGPAPTEFRPERFLEPGVMNPTAAFGFGRRICPGRHMADDSIFIAVTSILKVFTVSPPRDHLGNEMSVAAAFTSGLISQPLPFQCVIKPRSASAENLLLERSDD